VRHSLFAGGKRFRPILCLAAADALGASAGVALAPACALELIHTYSLVHDDLPAMDDAPLRRGAPTSHVVFGEAVAILAGDALLTLGFSILAKHPQMERYTPVRSKILALVTDAIGSEGMIGGQVADLEAERGRGAVDPLTPPLSRREREKTGEHLLSIHEAKTGRLIRAALGAGGLLAFAPEAALLGLDAYGRALGLAFQIKDDLLDVESDAATLGKRTGADSAAQKLTFPAVFGVDRSRALLAQNIEEAVAVAVALPGGGGRLAELARFVGERRS
jgi:geranylgeranyl pyrophosphate synthase